MHATTNTRDFSAQRLGLGASLLAGGLMMALLGCNQAVGSPAAPPVPEVAVVTVQPRDLPAVYEYVGQVAGVHEVAHGQIAESMEQFKLATRMRPYYKEAATNYRRARDLNCQQVKPKHVAVGKRMRSSDLVFFDGRNASLPEQVLRGIQLNALQADT